MIVQPRQTMNGVAIVLVMVNGGKQVDHWESNSRLLEFDKGE